ncbi:MAG: glycosyltransferase, partial [Bacteroidia bacterium]|nr:glycosyltransferase [Bacteroidia bacterium]
MIYKKLIDIASFSPRLLPHPSAWLGFLPFAGWLIREISPRIFVELGTHYGHSYFSFCQAVSDFNCSTKCYAVDTWHGDEHAGEYDDEVYSFVLDHQKKYYESFSTLLRMYFDEAAETFSHSSIDLVHIDGLHTYEAVRHDFETWLPKLSPGAVVLFHDTNVRERNFGVWRFWEELQTYYPNNLSFMHSSGLGVLQLNNAPKEKIIDWLRPDFQEKLQLVQYFTALGQRQLERYALEEIAQQLKFVKKSLGDRESRVHELNLAVADRDAQMHQLNASLEQRDTIVHQLNQVVSDREAKIDHLNRTLVARAEEVNGLRRVVETRARKMAALVEAQRAKADVGFQPAGGGAKKNFLQTAAAFRSRRRGEREQLKNLQNALSRQPLLDSDWYLDQYPDVRQLSVDPIQHYVIAGAREGKNPNPYFFTAWYLQEYPDVAAAGLNPLLHYLEHGVSERRNPNPYFDITWYLETYPEAVTSGMDPLLHYLRQEKNSRTDPHPLFHAHWYLEQYPEVAQNDMEPLLHYVLFGWREGKNPNPYFFTNWYVQRYPWAVDRCGNPFLHFLQFAVEEKTSPNPYIDTAWYLQAYPESAEYTGGPLAHYLHNAPAGRVNPNPYLETDWYLTSYPDVAANGLEPLLHYILYGAVENRNPGPHFDTAWYRNQRQHAGLDDMNPLLLYLQQGERAALNPNPYFDGQWYLQQYPDTAESSMSPFRHFLEIGLKEGRMPHPDYDAFTYQSAYAKWLHRFFLLDDQDREIIRHHINEFQSPPLISVVMPVYNPPPEYLDRAIQSVRNQLYPHWELCIADDASTDPEIVRVLHRHCTEDARIKVMYRGENGHISNCSNSALEMATGEYIALLDHDDLLAEDALFWVADAILRHPDAGLIYSDEDKIDDCGHRLDPYFKSDWNPFLFLGHNMVSHLGVYRSSLVRQLGGFRVGYEGSQDYDLAARVVEQLSESQVVHIPRILYH